MILLNVCLSDIPKENIIMGNNGKEYVNLVLDERREVGRFGDTHSICLTQTKEMREAKEGKVYVGSGKEFTFQKREEQAPTPTVQQPKQAESSDAFSDTDDLPF